MATEPDKTKISVLAQLAQVIDERARTGDAKSSHTAKLLAAGTEKCAKKFGEEAVELALAAMTGDKAHITAEAGDTLYHFLVLLQATGVPPQDVMDELAERFSQSGLKEKASRPSKSI